MIKKWLVLPLKEKSAIEDRLSAVEALIENEGLREDLAVLLKPIGDIERLISKVAVGRINPREMNHLKRALKQLGPLSELLNSTDIKALNQLGDQINPCELLLKEIEDNLKDETPLVSNQGGLINDGIHSELDDLRKISFSGKDYLLQIQKREGERTGIQSLKIAYNKVFGYYLEVTNAHKDKVPEEWIRKQTLVNAERYITEELKTYEEKILNAEEKIIAIEQRLYLELVVKAAEYIEQIQQDARILARMDCLLSFAELAIKNKYARPTINDGSTVDIKEGRHPVIESQLPVGESYVPNDVILDKDGQQIMIITGPNMAGKSALLRQTALIVLMAQMGSFVPATYARLVLLIRFLPELEPQTTFLRVSPPLWLR